MNFSSVPREQVVIIGAGAAGLMAAIASGQRGRAPLVLEKNNKLGVKILMSGGTRCNITHATDGRGVVAAFGRNGRFLYSALAAFAPEDVVEFFQRWGVPTHVEATGKIFPDSNRAIDVRDALVRAALDAGARLRAGQAVLHLDRAANGSGFRVQTASEVVECETLILTTGGKSYPGCGTTGDGYAWAAKFGHRIVATYPALTPLVCEEPWVHTLSGVTLEDVRLRLWDPSQPKRPLDERRGSFLFTHFGFSGPAPMNLSGAYNRHPNPESLQVVASFLPDETPESLAVWLREGAAAEGKRKLGAVLQARLPKRLVESSLARAAVDPDRPLAEISQAQVARLVTVLLECSLPLRGTKGYGKAEVTTGGVALDEVDSRTLQSKLVPGLYFAGEILDLDGPIGGFNFQSAFSTGWLAGSNA